MDEIRNLDSPNPEDALTNHDDDIKQEADSNMYIIVFWGVFLSMAIHHAPEKWAWLNTMVELRMYLAEKLKPIILYLVGQ